MSNNEWKLVEDAKEGDTHAFARLYEKYYADLYRFAFCYVKHAQMAEDAVSQAVLKAYENLRGLRKNNSFKSWLFQITANECRKMLGRKESYLEDVSWQEPQDMEEGYAVYELEELLLQLSDEERLIISMSVFANYNSKEIAAILHKKAGTVRSLKSRALAKLRVYLEEQQAE